MSSTVRVEAARIPDRDRLLEALLNEGLDAEPEDEIGIVVPAFWTAICGLAMNYSAYESEIYRAGLQAVPRGQMEAALSLGLAASVGAAGDCVSAAGGSGSVAAGAWVGACAGRGFGSGTAERRTALCGLCGRVPNRSSHGKLGARRAASAGPACMPRQSSRAAAVTIAAPPRRNAPTGHFRLAFSALKFMSVP